MVPSFRIPSIFAIFSIIMADFITLHDAANVAKILGLFAFTSAGIQLSGMRVGPLRALSLALKSKYFGPKVEFKSVREENITKIQSALRFKTANSYIVVVGDKGVGKSCMIETALQGMKGVVSIGISADMKEAKITALCQNEITGGSGCKIVDQTSNVNRVLFWYKLFFRGQMPVVVMKISEVYNGELPLTMIGAVHGLCKQGVNVVVASTPHSLPPELLETTRELVIKVEALSREEILLLPQLADLFNHLKKAHLSDVVLDLLGGTPSLYVNLSHYLEVALNTENTCGSADDTATVVTKFLLNLVQPIYDAAFEMKRAAPEFSNIFSRMADGETIDERLLRDKKLQLPSHCKILRQTGTAVVPASPLVALYFKHRCDPEATAKAMLRMIKEARMGSKVQVEEKFRETSKL